MTTRGGFMVLRSLEQVAVVWAKLMRALGQWMVEMFQTEKSR